MDKEAIQSKSPEQVGNHNQPGLLIVDNSVSISGAYRSLVSHLDILEKDFRYYFAVPGGIWDNAPFKKQHIYRFQYLEISKSWKMIFYLPRLVINTLKAHNIIREHQIRILHINDLYNMMGVLLKLLNPSIKLIYHVRLLRSSYAAPVYSIWRYLVKRAADHIICVSKAVLSDMGRHPKIEVIYDSLPQRWHANVNHQKEQTPEVQALYIGNYIPGKGQDYALKALKEVIKEVPYLRLRFVGDLTRSKSSKEFRSSLEKTVEAQKLKKYVSFSGYTQDVRPEILASDFVVNFSESESFSMTCLEALACHRPVVVTNCGGPAEIIRPGQNGLLVANRNISEMSQALIQMTSDSKLREKFSNNARIDFKHKFNLYNSSQQLRKAYLE